MSNEEEIPENMDTNENSVSAKKLFHRWSWFSRLCLSLNQNESAETTTSSGGKETEFDNKIETDRGKRFDFLLKQTEIFTHFMTNAAKKSPPKSKGRPKKKESPDTSGSASAE